MSGIMFPTRFVNQNCGFSHLYAGFICDIFHVRKSYFCRIFCHSLVFQRFVHIRLSIDGIKIQKKRPADRLQSADYNYFHIRHCYTQFPNLPWTSALNSFLTSKAACQSGFTSLLNEVNRAITNVRAKKESFISLCLSSAPRVSFA